MIKRIKVLLSVLLFVVAFSYIKVNAGECGGGKYDYLYKECTYNYTIEENGTYGPNLYYGTEIMINILADGNGGYSIVKKGTNHYNSQTTQIMPDYSITSSSGLEGLFKSGDSFACPEHIYFGSPVGKGKTLDLSSRPFSVSATTYAYVGRLDRNNHTCSNQKPFMKESESEKGMCKVTVYDYDLTAVSDDLSDFHYTSTDVQVYVKYESGSWKFYKNDKQINSVDVKGKSYPLTVSQIAEVANGTASCGSLKVFCNINNCMLTNNNTAVQTSDNAGTSDHRDDEYLDEMGDIFGNVDDPGSCDTLLDADAKELIITIFNWIRIITPILLVLLGALDFGKAVLASDEKQMAAATKNFITRCVIALAIFFVPLIIYYFMDIIMKSTGIVDDAGNICKFL